MLCAFGDGLTKTRGIVALPKAQQNLVALDAAGAADSERSNGPVLPRSNWSRTRLRRAKKWSAPGVIRTRDLSLRRRALYPLSYGRLEPESTGFVGVALRPFPPL